MIEETIDSTSRPSALDTTLRVTAIVLAIALVSILTFVPLSQNDFWLQAAVGRIILQTGEIPHTVLFTFTWARDSPFFPHEWLPSIAFYLLLKAFGYQHLLFAQGALGLVLFGLSLALAYRMSRSAGMSIIFACMAMLVANYRHFLRPELVALVLFLVELHLLTLYRLHGRRQLLLWSIPLAVVWANSHGSFIIGPIVAALFALGEAIEAARRARVPNLSARMADGVRAGLPYALIALAMAVASLANPLGVHLYDFVWTVSNSDAVKAGIGEWHPTFSNLFMGLPGFKIFIGCLVITVLVIATRLRRLTATDVLLLLAFLLLATTRLRYVVLFGFVAMLICSRLVRDGASRSDRERLALGASIAASSVGIALALEFGNAYGAYPYYANSTDFTEPMIEQLSDSKIKGNVFNSYELGAELIYRTYPRLRPSMDSRADSYGDAYFLMQLQLLSDEHLMNEFLSDFDVRYMLLTWRDFNLLKKMLSLRTAWKLQFADHRAVLLVRQTAHASPVATVQSAPQSATLASVSRN